jgi:hypothetical protein
MAVTSKDTSKHESVLRVAFWTVVLAASAAILWEADGIHDRGMRHAQKTFDYVKKTAEKNEAKNTAATSHP